MNTFTIDIDNNITANLRPQDAEAIAGAETFRSEATLAKLAANWPAERLVDIWNGIPGVTPVRKFKDRKTGVSRIWKAIQILAQESQPAKPEAAPRKPELEQPKATTAEQPETPPLNAEPAREEVQQPVEVAPTSEEPAAEEVQPPAAAEAVPSPEPAAAEPIQAADTNSSAEAAAPPAKAESPEKAPAKSDGARAGSKAATILDLMKRSEGVTLKELMPYASHCTSLA